MPYTGYNFVYAGIPSQRYGVMFAAFDSTTYKYVGGSENEITTDKSSRSLRQTLLSVNPSVALQLEVELLADHALNLAEVNAIHTWLCGQNKYQPLRIQAPEYAGIHFNCLFNAPSDYYIMDGANGFKYTVLCDSPGAWSNELTKTYTPTSGGTIVFNNISANEDYLYPAVSFTLSGGTSFNIKNSTDSSTRLFAFDELTDGETITVNGETGQITSSLGYNRISKFNKNFLRLKHGPNNLICTGNISSLVFKYENFIRIGD